MNQYPVAASGLGYQQYNRIHAFNNDWNTVATDYWLYPNSSTAPTGWTYNSIVFTNTVTGDFLSSADDTPPNLNSDASGDLIVSPIILGNYSHQLAVSKLMGYTPQAPGPSRLPLTLNCEFYAAFTTATANETATHMGFNNGAAAVMAVYSDGTNFKLYNGSASSAAGPAVDNAYHVWTISITGATATWYVDGVLRNTLAIVNDVWPTAFKCVASTTNRFACNWIHVWYS